jgi:gas vesicle protein
MRKEKLQDDATAVAAHETGHPFARGVLAGAAVGVGVGLLFAPRSGKQIRQEVGHQLSNMKTSCASGYTRAKGTAGEWAARGRRAYGTTRDKLAHGAHETREYVKEVSDAVMRKSHRETRIPARSDMAVAAAREPTRAIGPRP